MAEPPDWSDAEPRPTAGAEPARRTLPARLRLVVLSGPDRGRELLLERGTYLIGKHPRSALVLSDELVSRQHLELRIEADRLAARDLGSRNGSFFRGARFTEIAVESGAVITLGATELKLLSDVAPVPLLPSDAQSFGKLRGRSLVMRELFAVLERAAPSDAIVLIEGETGTGKEVCAESIHIMSARSRGPFAVCDLGAVSRSLLEAELFGHAKGSFTGALRDRPGVIESAHGGTLFLDEIGELDLDLQPRLLRAIERRQVKRVGESALREVDTRVVAATNRDLVEEVRAGRFREDLLTRLQVVRVRLPPLRERKEDLPLLAAELLAGAPITDEALALLAEYDWPGNVRELRNVLERGLTLVQPGVALTPAHLAMDSETPVSESGGADFHLEKERTVDAWERQFLRRLLARTNGNVSKAARQSGLGRAHLYRLLKKHKMEED